MIISVFHMKVFDNIHNKPLENIVAFFGPKNFPLCIGQAWNSTVKGVKTCQISYDLLFELVYFVAV